VAGVGATAATVGAIFATVVATLDATRGGVDVAAGVNAGAGRSLTESPGAGLSPVIDRTDRPMPIPIRMAIMVVATSSLRITQATFARMIPVGLTYTLGGGHPLVDVVACSDLGSSSLF